MEHLKTYESDEESKGEVKDNIHENKNNSVVSMDSNFFNLQSPCERIEAPYQGNSDSQCRKEEKTDKCFEIPDSDFWSGFDPSENLHVKDSFMTFPSKSTIKHSESCNPSTMTASFQDNRLKRTIDTATSCSHSAKRHKDGEKLEESFTRGENRKIFFVHSKIMTGLSMTPTCKCSTSLQSSWPCHDNTINKLTWSIPDFSHLIATGGMDSLIKIYNVWSRLDKCVSRLTTHSKAVRTILWGHTGRTILSASYDKTAGVTDVETGTAVSQFQHRGFVTALAKHPSNHHCFVSGSENVIQMWDQRRPSAPVKTFNFRDKLGQVQDLLFIQDGQELLSCTDVVARDSADRTIMAWDVRSGVVLSNQIFQERYTCTRLKLHPSGSHFLAQTQGGYVAAFSTCRPYKMDKSKRFEGHQMQGYNIGFDISHDGSFLCSGSAEGGIHCYDYRSGRLIRKCSTNKNSVITDVACHPVLPSVLAAGSWGGHLSLWQ